MLHNDDGGDWRDPQEDRGPAVLLGWLLVVLASSAFWGAVGFALGRWSRP